MLFTKISQIFHRFNNLSGWSMIICYSCKTVLFIKWPLRKSQSALLKACTFCVGQFQKGKWNMWNMKDQRKPFKYFLQHPLSTWSLIIIMIISILFKAPDLSSSGCRAPSLQECRGRRERRGGSWCRPEPHEMRIFSLYF